MATNELIILVPTTYVYFGKFSNGNSRYTVCNPTIMPCSIYMWLSASRSFDRSNVRYVLNYTLALNARLFNLGEKIKVKLHWQNCHTADINIFSHVTFLICSRQEPSPQFQANVSEQEEHLNHTKK
jgi:hypothetical protein